MICAIIGLPQCGKSTLFAAATGVQPHPGEMPHLKKAVVQVPDERLAFLAKLNGSKKITHATVEFWDFPGFSLADSHGRDQFRKFLPDVRQAEALVVVVRDFANDAVPLYRDRIDPDADVKEVWEELVFGDLETVTTRLEKLEKSLNKPTQSHEHEKRELAILQRCQEALENGKPISSVLTGGAEETGLLANFPFLTEIPLIVVYNVSEDRAAEPGRPAPEHARGAVTLSAEVEAEIAALEAADRQAFLADLGLTEPAGNRLTRACHDVIGCITFLTTGPTETRAWSLPRGSTAVEAAGRIHSDLERGFIRAETIAFDELRAAGDFKKARTLGKLRQEGKGYVVQEGDILLIKFNV